MYYVSKLNFTTVQKNSLQSLMKNTSDKRHYRRLLAVIQKTMVELLKTLQENMVLV